MSIDEIQSDADKAAAYLARLTSQGVHHSDALDMTRSYIGSLSIDRRFPPNEAVKPKTGLFRS